MANCEPFSVFFTNRYPHIGEKIIETLSTKDLLNIMQFRTIEDFLVDEDRFLKKVLEEKDDFGETVLHKAVNQNDWKAAKLLKAICKRIPKEHVGMQCNDGNTPLILAAYEGKNKCAKILCQFMSNEHTVTTNSKGSTALDIAVLYGRVKIAETLVQYMSNGQTGELCQEKDDFGETLLHKTVNDWNDWKAAKLLTAICKRIPKEHVGMQCNDGNTPLILAAYEGKNKCAKILCQFMSSEQIVTTNSEGLTALDIAAGEGHHEIVRFLCDNLTQHQLGMTNGFGDTALMRAAKNGHVECVKVLCQFMSNEQIVMGQNGYKNAGNALCYAAIYGHVKTVKILLQYMSLKQVGKYVYGEIDDFQVRSTALKVAVKYGQTEIVRILCEKLTQQHLAMTSYEGDTALITAAIKGHQECVKILCKHMSKEQITMKDNDDRSALYYAERNGHEEIAHIILQNM